MLLAKNFSSQLFRRSKRIPFSCVSVSNVFEERRNSSTTVSSVLETMFQYSSSCNITTGLQFCIEEFHALTGLGWGGTFVASAILLRLASSPAHILAEKLFAEKLYHVNNINKKFTDAIYKQLNIKFEPGITSGQIETLAKDNKVFTVVNRHIAENIEKVTIEKKLFTLRIYSLKFSTVPIWLFSSCAVRNIISGDFSPSIPGALWLSDLMLPDPYYILPATLGLIGFLNMYSQRLVDPTKNKNIAKIHDVLLALATIVCVKISIDLPACLSLYWLAVSVSGLVQIAIIRYPKFKKLLGIKKLPTDSKYPIVNLFRRRE
ncbi:Mitochondrial inner membrane protein COX18 [Strongyloides ratti]|uniref:Mitochondrial inner membrane protein COX18 n=1 Tax=Strongyloides ratti TaxID=34506 RepID=A0A090MYK0_STRRB|nr:Mitochondrial inner membrane protein COX18 [Strongyloides ratti]CEF67319.1 Mitochondrial inner membrane protein COX18 [Strongyloides ratti]